MRYVFLDVDGVLNNRYTKNGPDSGYVYGAVALDFKNIDVFKKIMSLLYKKYGGKEKVKIVLSSSWRNGRDKDGNIVRLKKDVFMDALDKYLAEKDLSIDDGTPRLNFWHGRGAEIIAFLNEQTEPVDGYLVLDDHFADDFSHYKITRHWVQTKYSTIAGVGGLQDKHIEYALRTMEHPLKEDELEMIRTFPTDDVGRCFMPNS